MPRTVVPARAINVVVLIEGPSTSRLDVDGLAALWRELHRHHLRTASYRPLAEKREPSEEGTIRPVETRPGA